jgi:hypothetical protein
VLLENLERHSISKSSTPLDFRLFGVPSFTMRNILSITCATSLLLLAVAAAKRPQDVYCPGRGGCECNCAWANSQTCQKDDGSCCFACCCDTPPGPPPPPPGPGPSPSLVQYCPSSSDLIGADGTTVTDGGWTTVGFGFAATLASFNLLGGSVEYDIDVRNVNIGVNANIYSISPSGIGSGGFSQEKYCDGSKTGSDWCVEVDWIESNGNCGGQTTLHTVQGPGEKGCTAWGCAAAYDYNGRAAFHMKVTFNASGLWTTYRNGQAIYPWNLNPAPQQSDWNTLVSYYTQYGAVIYSSQWVGWVPTPSGCGGSPGNIGGSSFTVSNLKITGAVVQGPTPTLC